MRITYSGFFAAAELKYKNFQIYISRLDFQDVFIFWLIFHTSLNFSSVLSFLIKIVATGPPESLQRRFRITNLSSIPSHGHSNFCIREMNALENCDQSGG